MRNVLTNLLGAVGVGLVAAAAWLVYMPAGLAVAGVALVLAAWRLQS